MDYTVLESVAKSKRSLTFEEITLPRNSHWAISHCGQNITLFYSPNFHWQSNSSPLLFIGGLHGDEYEGVELAQCTLTWLNSLYLDNPQKKISPWVLIPCINPDGYQNNQRTNARGVDLNRNFPARDWSPKVPSLRYNPGIAPASEPEVRALIAFISNYRPRLIIHCHSWHPSITYTGSAPPPEARVLAQCTGYPLQSDIGYPTPGSLGQFAWLEYNIPVICIEEQEGTPRQAVWPHFEKAIKEIFVERSF